MVMTSFLPAMDQPACISSWLRTIMRMPLASLNRRASSRPKKNPAPRGLGCHPAQPPCAERQRTTTQQTAALSDCDTASDHFILVVHHGPYSSRSYFW